MRVQCPTCLEEFTPEDDLQCPPCGHVFHRHCIHEWFNYKRASGDKEDCPQCRTVTKIQKLRRIYPTEAEAYVESQENSDEDLHIQIEEIQNQLQIKEGVVNLLLDRAEELESNLKELELDLCEQTNEFKRRKQTEKYLFASVAINILLFGLGVSYHYNALLNDA